MKKMDILLILMICAFLCCCGKSGASGAYIKSNPYMELHEDADVDFYDIWDSVDFQEDTDHVPEKINNKNFVAYFISEGSPSSETKCIICNEGGTMTAYARTFENGMAKTFSGNVKEELLYESLSCLYFEDIPSNATDGGTSSYSFIYYKENGNVYRCPVNNILDDYHIFLRQFARKQSIG